MVGRNHALRAVRGIGADARSFLSAWENQYSIETVPTVPTRWIEDNKNQKEPRKRNNRTQKPLAFGSFLCHNIAGSSATNRRKNQTPRERGTESHGSLSIGPGSTLKDSRV